MRDFLFSLATSRRWLVALSLLAGAAPALAQTQTFNYIGPSTQSYTVPAGITKVNVTAFGGGGSGNGGSTSFGARVDATVPVTPGEALTVVVGGAPDFNTNSGGYNGGGYGSNNNSGGGGGTDLRRTGTATGDYLAGRNALLVAGGGGGGNGTNVGGNGGSGGTSAGANGSGGAPGRGATQSGPGASGGGSATAGSNATGGSGNNGGGGGGGGYYGGGGAYKGTFTTTASGGGGGSSWVLAAGSNVSYATSSALYGSLAITPTPPSISGFSPATGTFGITVTITGDFVNGATGVLFNGVAASSFTLVNATTITAVVPSSTTGPISVVGLGGPGTSASNFTPLYLSVTGLSPARHALTAAPGTTVGLTLSQAPTAASAAGIRIFSSQYKGRRTASAGVSGNTATLTLGGGSFRPGEVVQVSVPPTVQSSGGTRALAQVYQFTTAAAGTGVGNFLGGSDPVVGSTPARVVPADVDGDGDLDLIVTAVAFNNTGPNTAYVRLNNGSGGFSGGSDVAVGANPAGLAVGDVDGDGDLDLVTANDNANTASVRLNTSGTFGGTQEVSVGAGPAAVVLGDVDGDGDLDLVTANYNHANGSNTASVRLNGGDASGSNTGVFSGGSNPIVINGPDGLALGDVDNDGDLDLLTYSFGNTVNVRLNNGGGMFAGGSTFTVAGNANGLVLGDVNGDGYLDAVTAGYNGNAASVRLNSGSGTFAGGSDLGFSGLVSTVTLGDVDADGDLDLVANNGSTNNAILVSTRLNNGSGTFAGGSDINMGGFPYGLALADVDGDNDLDLLAANYSGSGTVNVRLNQVAAPIITAVAPNPGGLGQSITLTGTSLASPTALTINGANALAGIISNSGTSLVVRVPVTAAASGNVVITTAGGTASLAFTVMAPPGNALAFDGVDDYLALPAATPVPLGNTAYTVEAWVNPNSMNLGSIIGWGNYGTTNQANGLSLNTTGLINYWWSNDLQKATPSLVGRWHHVAATYDGTIRTLYLDGVALGSDVPGVHAVPNASNLRIGSNSNGVFTYLNGRLDEVRVYSVALTAAQLQADMTSTAAAVPASLVLYYNFDQGTPATASTGANTTYTTLYDLSNNATPGTLTGFALTSGNTTSNYLESYALVVPTATAASALSGTGFTANWTAPALGTVDNGYRLDVSTVSTFASVIAGSPFTVASGTSRAISGLTTGTTYYYRVRADKTSVTGQGAPSNTISVVPCPAPVATAQNATVALSTSGSATVAATAVNNGSTANCGAATAGTLSLSPSAFSCADAVPATVANALSFNGSTQYVEGTNANLPLGNAARTIEAWVYPTAAGQNGAIFNYGTPTNNLRSGVLLISGKLYYVGENNDLSGNIVLPVNTWSHVAATYDGSTLRLYVNGVLDASSNPGAFNTTGTIWRIAQRSYPQTGEFLTGRVDEVRVWNVARSATQISANRNVGLPGGTAGLVAYYRLNEGSGSTTADATASASAGTLYNAPTWTTSAAPVVNGVPVTLTVTSVDGNTSTATAIVTVLDNIAPAAAGSGPLPAAPVLATSNVPEAGGYGVLYQLDVPNAANFNALAAVPYAVNNSAAAIANPTRVAYFLELNNGASTKWVWASMDNFASNLTQLGLPNPTANNKVWSQSVANLNVFSSTGAGVTTGSSLGTGRVEMWPWNYTQGNVDNVPGADGGTYDFGDQVNVGSGNYGSFQVHNVTNAQTVLAYNNWGSNGGNSDLGIGNQVGGSGNPDWTFAYNAGGYTVKRLYILVPNGSAFTQPAAVQLNAAGTATVAQSAVYTGAADNCAVASVVITPSTFSCANVGQNTVTVAVSDASGNTTTQSAFVTVSVPPTPTTTWNGAASTVWTDCANWSYGQVPDAATNVVIPTGQPRYPTVSTGTVATKDLTINNGGSLTLNGGTTLQVSGNAANSGTATLSGTVAFVGSAATQTLGIGTGFTTLVVNKPTGTVQLTQSLTINSALTLTSGTLTTTGTYQVNLGGSASLSESETSYVLGKVVVNRTLVPGTAQAFSGLGLTLTPAAGSTAPGATVLTRTTGTALAGAGTSQSILRNFNIQPATNTGLNVTMNFAYFTHELNGIAVGNLALFKSVSGGTPWIPQRGTTAAGNVVTKTGISDFSIWTLGNSANPLPVELAEFTVTAHGRAVQLQWSTASEKNTQAFEVERSLSGTGFERIATVAAAGNSSAPRNYELLDNQVPKTPSPQDPIYYRLKQLDQDGTFSYSPVRGVRLSEATAGLALYPNPTTARATLTGAQPGTTVTVVDALGRTVLTVPADATGTAALTLPAGLATGVYVVRAGTQALRLTVE